MSSTYLDELQADIKLAMKSRENEKLTALRTLHAQIKDATVNAGKEPEDGDVAAVVAKAIKQRADAAGQFRQGGREDLAARETQEAEWFKKYQPRQLDEPAIERLARDCIAASGAAGIKDRGKVMQALMPQVKGLADGALVSQVVARLLGG